MNKRAFMKTATAPVLTALPTSKVGIAFGPPMKLICKTPLPSVLTFCTQGSRRCT